LIFKGTKQISTHILSHTAYLYRQITNSQLHSPAVVQSNFTEDHI